MFFKRNSTRTKSPVVSVIGSSRIHRPLIAARDLKLIRLNNTGLRSYTHSVAEIWQKLNYSYENIIIPEELKLYINGTEEDGNLPLPENLNHDDTEVFVLEISSLKQLTLNNFTLQQAFFDQYFIKPNKLEKWWKKLVFMAKNQSAARMIASDEDIPADIREIANSVTLSINSREYIQQEIIALKNYLKRPLVIVGPIVMPDSAGMLIEDRVQLDKILSEAAALTKSAYFRPGKLLEIYGKDVALQKDSTTHWNDSFLPIIGKHIASEVILPFMKKQGGFFKF